MPDDPETNSATARVWKRGSTFNAVKRARQFPDDFIAKGEEIMWCTSCQCSVSWLEKSHAKNHLSSASHKRAKLNAGKLNKQPGLSAPVESPPVAATSTQPPPSTTIPEVNDNTRTPAVVKVLNQMRVDPGDVYAFSSDRASVLRKAYDDILKPVCPKAVWVSCLSHGLNNVAKSIIADLDSNLVRIFELAVDQSAKKATMVFACEATEIFITAINVAQTEGEPVAVIMLDCLADLQSALEANTYHPRVVTALEAMANSAARLALKNKFSAAQKHLLTELKKYLENQKSLLALLKKFRILDPRNVRDMDARWELYSDLFAVPISDDDDDDLRESKMKRNRQLQEEWGRYTRIEKANVQCCKDIDTFWSQRGGLLPAAVEPFLWFPLSSAAVERSFSLAGLIDAPNRQSMGERVREACVTMFFNGDVEQRFTKD